MEGVYEQYLNPRSLSCFEQVNHRVSNFIIFPILINFGSFSETLIMANFSYTPVIAEAHTPPYKIHKYFARRPHNVFSELIDSFSDTNEVVVDPFCGGGVTIYEGLRKGRKVIGFDLNPLSTFIVRNMVLSDGLNEAFYTKVADLKNYLRHLTGDYCVFTYKKKEYTIDWAELSMSVKCPYCNRITPLSNNLKVKNGQYRCVHDFCPSHTNEQTVSSTTNEHADPQYLFLVHDSNGKRVVKEFDFEDRERYDAHIVFLKAELKKERVVVPQDLIPLDWDRQFEDGLAKKGILYFQDFFTKRNLYILLLLLNRIKTYEKSLSQSQYELLRLVFSNILKDTNIMSFTNDGWQSGKPTTWSKHAYWVPNQYCEVSIEPFFDKSLERIVSAITYNQQQGLHPVFAKEAKSILNSKANILLQNTPINLAGLPDNSVDAIITDPPYGSNVQYLELSHFWYPWNKDLYERYPIFEMEAISNRKRGFKGAKDQYTYENNLFPVFEASYRCLKSERYMTLTFNNKDMSSWLGLLFSIFRAGFTYDNLYFQDGVKNYKQTAHTKAEGSPYGDFIYVFKKANTPINLPKYDDEISFTRELDCIFGEFLKNVIDRNETILAVFQRAIPIIEGFSKSYLKVHPEHSLYSHFNKNYLAKLYEK